MKEMVPISFFFFPRVFFFVILITHICAMP